jgi:hypothetical protein
VLEVHGQLLDVFNDVALQGIHVRSYDHSATTG